MTSQITQVLVSGQRADHATTPPFQVRMGPRMIMLRRLRAKLDEEPKSRPSPPYPPLRSSNEPSLRYRKLRGGGRRS